MREGDSEKDILITIFQSISILRIVFEFKQNKRERVMDEGKQ